MSKYRGYALDHNERETVMYALDVLDAMNPRDADLLVEDGPLQFNCLRDLREHRDWDLRSAASFFLMSLDARLQPWSHPDREPDQHVRVDAHAVPDDVCGLARPRPPVYGCTDRAGMLCPTAGVCALHGCQGPLDTQQGGGT